VLETVGFGAGAELVDGAGAGAELGGASVGVGEELCEPGPPVAPDELELLDGLEELDEGELPAEAVAAWPACAVGWAPDAPAHPFLWCRWLADGIGVPAADAEVEGCVPGTVAD
jgi:hypothetical protein